MLGEKLCKDYENEHPPALKTGLDAHMGYGTERVPTKSYYHNKDQEAA